MKAGSEEPTGNSAIAISIRAIVRTIEYFGRAPSDREVKLIVGAVRRYLDEPDAPTTRLQ